MFDNDMDLSGIHDFTMDRNDTMFGDQVDILQALNDPPKQQPVVMQNLPSKIAKYTHKQLNSLYYLQPNSNSVYLLDFKKQQFVKEKIEQNMVLPQYITSVQKKNGTIYIVGGVQSDQILRSTFELKDSLLF